MWTWSVFGCSSCSGNTLSNLSQVESFSHFLSILFINVLTYAHTHSLTLDWIGIALYVPIKKQKNKHCMNRSSPIEWWARCAKYIVCMCTLFSSIHTIKTKISANFQSKMEQWCRTNYFFGSQFIYWSGTIFMFILIPAADFLFFISMFELIFFLSACCLVMRRLAKGKHAKKLK